MNVVVTQANKFYIGAIVLKKKKKNGLARNQSSMSYKMTG